MTIFVQAVEKHPPDTIGSLADLSGQHYVTIFEKDERHPGGEVLVSCDGAVHEVARTDAVERLLASGQLVEVPPG